ncbi:hypothetical protein GW17_00046818 [Ensete ventricosum]|nr:hypothetical protein GW17_00046818 [Ensete ventricosum]
MKKQKDDIRNRRASEREETGIAIGAVSEQAERGEVVGRVVKQGEGKGGVFILVERGVLELVSSSPSPERDKAVAGPWAIVWHEDDRSDRPNHGAHAIVAVEVPTTKPLGPPSHPHASASSLPSSVLLPVSIYFTVTTETKPMFLYRFRWERFNPWSTHVAVGHARVLRSGMEHSFTWKRGV